jgi:hypothetical protein
VTSATRAALERAKARLDRLDYYGRPVSIRHVRVFTVPWLFRLPYFKRFDGYAAHWTILLRQSVGQAGDDLVTHELCHVWQMQQHPVRMPLSYLVTGYEGNPYEQQARRAAAETRSDAGREPDGTAA